jgi:hypothetical protein
MIDWLPYRYKLFRLQIERRKTQQFYSNAYRKAKQQNKGRQELDDIGAEEQHFVETVDDEIAQLQSRYLKSKAEKLFLPVPEFSLKSEKWERSDVSGRYRLTRAAMLELRSAIRAERKESSELARSWLTGLTGLVGVLIGLLAVILGRR